MRFPRPSPLLFVAPTTVLDTDAVRGLDLRAWSRDEYAWEVDAWNGLKDTIQPVKETIRTGRGDCEDYAAVAASWLHSLGRSTRIAFCYSSSGTGHVIALDDERTYSSGAIADESLDGFLARTDYDVAFVRRVGGGCSIHT